MVQKTAIRETKSKDRIVGKPNFQLSILGIRLLLLLITVFNLFSFSSIFKDGYIKGWDTTSHYVYTVRLAELFAEGNYRLWLPDFSMGMPLYYYYQPLPHVATAFLYNLFPVVSPLIIMKLIVVLLLLVFPLSIYKGLRWMGISVPVAIISAVLVYTLESWVGLGIELKLIFQWGLYTHLWGLVLMPLTIGYCYKNFFGKQRLLTPILLLGILFWTHVLSALMCSMAIAILWVIPKWNLKSYRNNLFHLGAVFIGSFTFFALVFIPTLQASEYMSGYFKLDEEHHLGLGVINLFQHLGLGDLFDANTFPVFSLLFGIGVLLLLRKIINSAIVEDDFNRSLATYFLLNIVLVLLFLMGSKTFSFLQYTPLHNNLPYLRMIPWLHFFALPIVSWTLWQFFLWSRKKWLQYSSSTILNWIYVIPFLCLAAYFLNRMEKNTQKIVGTSSVHTNKDYFEALSFLKGQEDGRINLVQLKNNAELFLPPLFSDKPIGRFSAAGNRGNLGQFYLYFMDDYNLKSYEIFDYNYALTTKRNQYKFQQMGLSPIFQNDNYAVYQTYEDFSYFDLVQSDIVCLSHNKAARNLIQYWHKHTDIHKSKQHITIAEDRTTNEFQDLDYRILIDPLENDSRESSRAIHLTNLAAKESIQTNIDNRDATLAKYLHPPHDSISPMLGRVIDSYHEAGLYKATIQVNSNPPDNPISWALLKVNAHPDWIAKVNGKLVKWTQMNPCFMAVPLEEGIHKVEFEFGVNPLRKTLFVLAFIVIIIAAYWDKKRSLW